MVAAQKAKDAATHETPAADRLALNEPGPLAATMTAHAAPRSQPEKPPPRRPPVVAPGDDLESASDEDDNEDEDADDPFADRNFVGTPAVERHEPRW